MEHEKKSKTNNKHVNWDTVKVVSQNNDKEMKDSINSMGKRNNLL